MASAGLNIAFAVFCLLSFGCGVSYSVLVSKLINFIFERIEAVEHLTETGTTAGVKTIMWMIGLAYIIPGFIGLIACIVRRRGLYIAQLSLSVIGLGILVVLFLLGMASTSMKASSPHFCEEIEGVCVCGEAQTQLLKYFSCYEINWMVRMGISVDAMLFGGGLITLIAAILAGCVLRAMRKEGSFTQQGTVLSMPAVQAVEGKFKANPYERFYE